MIDWLGSAEHRSVGASLMRKAHKSVPTQFGLGGSEAGRTVGGGGGYAIRDLIPVYQRGAPSLALAAGAGTRLRDEGNTTGP